MKTQFLHLFSLVLILASSVQTNAQIYYSEGKIGINTEPTETSKDITLKDCNAIEWSNGEYTKLTFDLSKNTPSISANGRLTFRTDNGGKFIPIYANGLRTYSNNGGTNFYVVLENILQKLLKLTPVEIHNRGGYVPGDNDLMDKSIGIDQGIETRPDFPLSQQIGFSVKDLENVLPSAVSYDEEGNSFIDYSYFIPLLVASIKELHATVEEQAAAIQALSISQSPAAARQITGLIKSCTPNPTSGTVSVEVEYPSDAVTVLLTVSTVAGTREAASIVANGDEKVEMDLSLLPSGIHVLSFFIDGVLADNTRIIKE